jgi:hypothetical protein
MAALKSGLKRILPEPVRRGFKGILYEMTSRKTMLSNALARAKAEGISFGSGLAIPVTFCMELSAQ